MRVAVVGSRRFENQEVAKQFFLKDLNDKVYELKKEGKHNITLVSGGAEGVDSWSKDYSFKTKIDHITFLPYFKLDKYSKFSPTHFFVRNRQIVDNCDILIAYWNGHSKGTLHAIDYAKKRGKSIIIVEIK